MSLPLRRVAVCFSLLCALARCLPDSLLVNVTEVAWATETSGEYLGSPSILQCPNGSLLFSHDLFGSGASTLDTAFTLRSDDTGATWVKTAPASPMYWATLFSRPNDTAVCLLGTTGGDARAQIAISRSPDCGSSWTTVVLTAAAIAYSTGPTPVLMHAGRMWRAFEQNTGSGWAQYSTPRGICRLLTQLISSHPMLGPSLAEVCRGQQCYPLFPHHGACRLFVQNSAGSRETPCNHQT